MGAFLLWALYLSIPQSKKQSDPRMERYTKVRAGLSSNDQQCLDSLVSQYEHYGNDRKVAKQKAAHIFAAAELIQKLIRTKDSFGIAKLIPNQLTVGPIKQSITSKPFEENFPKAWVDLFEMNSSYPCSELKYNARLGDPMSPIWFTSNSEGAPQIISIMGLPERPEKISSPSSWQYNGVDINVHCFTTKWASGDNYETFGETFNSGKYGDPIYEDFVSHPGTFIGKQIPVDMILEPWSSTPPIYLSPSLRDCNGFTYPDRQMKHTIYGSYDLSFCEYLAPNIKGSCVDMKLAQVNGPFGYSDVQSQTVLYGLFEVTKTGRTHVVPLLNFDLLNEGIVETEKYLKTEVVQ